MPCSMVLQLPDVSASQRANSRTVAAEPRRDRAGDPDDAGDPDEGPVGTGLRSEYTIPATVTAAYGTTKHRGIREFPIQYPGIRM